MRSTAELPTRTRAGVDTYTQERDDPTSPLPGILPACKAHPVPPDDDIISIDPETGIPFLNIDFGHTFTMEEIADIIAEGE